MQLEVNRHYHCQSCGRTYRCRVAGKPVASCGHSLQEQKEITKSEYSQVRMSAHRNLDRMEKVNKSARDGAEIYHIPVSDKDDAISIFCKVVGLNKRQVIRLFSHIGWALYWRRRKKSKAQAYTADKEKENAPPGTDDLEFFYELEQVVAIARGIPPGLRREMHPKFKEYSYFFALAIYQFAYCYPYVNNCSQEGICWLFDGLPEILKVEAMKESALLEAEEILKKQQKREI